jgi:hypothetical protein
MDAINTLAQNIVTALQVLGGVLVVGCLTWSGILWMTAAGNPRQLETARSALIGAFVGFAIVVAAPQIAGFIGSALGAAP